jgi:hypothetical protein
MPSETKRFGARRRAGWGWGWAHARSAARSGLEARDERAPDVRVEAHEPRRSQPALNYGTPLRPVRLHRVATLALAILAASGAGARMASADRDDDGYEAEAGDDDGYPGAPRRAPIDGDRIDQTMERALDQVYQREMPGWDNRGGGFDLGGGTGGAGRDPNGRGTGGAGRDPNPRGSGSGGGPTGGTGTGSGGVTPPDLGSGGTTNPTGGGSDAWNPDDHDGVDRRPNAAPGDPRAPRRRGGRDRNYSGDGDHDTGDSGAFGGVATALLWGLVIVVALLVIVFIVRQASSMTGEAEPVKTASDDDAEDPNRLAAVIERPRDDADQLAHEGRFAEAIHTLLLRTVHELASQNLVRVTPSMTSREVLAKVPMLGDARAALAGLVSAVELTWFGDDVPGAADYARCREQFELFAAAYRRGQQPGAQPAAPGILGARA